MGMSAFDQITLLHVIIPVPDVIAATAIIKAAVAVIIAHTVPKEAIPLANTAEATPGGDPIPMTHHNPSHLDNTTADHDLAEDIDPTAGANLDPQEGGTAVAPVP